MKTIIARHGFSTGTRKVEFTLLENIIWPRTGRPASLRRRSVAAPIFLCARFQLVRNARLYTRQGVLFAGVVGFVKLGAYSRRSRKPEDGHLPGTQLEAVSSDHSTKAATGAGMVIRAHRRRLGNCAGRSNWPGFLESWSSNNNRRSLLLKSRRGCGVEPI
jgi:hypothetical protein